MTLKYLLLSALVSGTSALVAHGVATPMAPAQLSTVSSSTFRGAQVFGVFDPTTLGTCTQAVHDAYAIDGGDGYRYRTWHPQVDPSGCVFGHEHGDDPNSVRHDEIRSQPVLFGYIGRRMPMPNAPDGHEEPHEGFKVFVANPGDLNDEGRTNRVYSRIVFHMGTGGPARFTQRFHSADIRIVHPGLGLKAFTRLMMDTGGSTPVCNPRRPSPTKDVVLLNSPCLLDSSYEIWSTQGVVRYRGQVVYRAFATPAVFDPITVFNPANPAELVYAWDPRVERSFRWKAQDRTGFRGCERESYAQPGHWYNRRTGRTVFYTDTLGNEVPATDPLAIAQTISASDSIGAPATLDGLFQFKVRRSWCGRDDALGLKN